MKITACLLVLVVAIPAVAQEPLKHDFRGSKFDRDVIAYSGLTPEKYITLKTKACVCATPAGAPPSNNTAGVAWRLSRTRRFCRHRQV